MKIARQQRDVRQFHQHLLGDSEVEVVKVDSWYIQFKHWETSLTCHTKVPSKIDNIWYSLYKSVPTQVICTAWIRIGVHNYNGQTLYVCIITLYAELRIYFRMGSAN